MDFVTSGSKNGSSLPVLRGTLSRLILRWQCWLTGFTQCAERCSGCACASRHGCRGLAGGRRGFCNKWQQKWFLFASSSWDSVEADSSLAVLVDWLCTVR